MTSSVLAGDIGATKTVLGLYDRDGSLLLEKNFHNKEWSDLSELISVFLDTRKERPCRACFGVAGPVRENRVCMTNLGWTIDGGILADRLGMETVLLVNDLVATAAGAVLLSGDKLVPLNPGHRDPHGSIGVLAVGTGLGQSFAVPDNDRFRPFPTEGGHVSFAPRNQEQIDLLRFMFSRHHQEDGAVHVSAEQVCSGMAVPALYDFMLTGCAEPTWMKEKRLTAAPDELTPLIVSAAAAAWAGGPPCESAVRTVRLLVDILAAETADLALKVLSTGGMYLGGGMVPRLLPFFERQRFMTAFSRGVYRQMLADIPVHLIMEPKAALFGARQLASEAGTD